MPVVIPLNDAINGMASLMGIAPVASKYFTRLLREDGRGLWPDLGRGRRAATVHVSDLVHLWMAIALSESQPNESPRAVHEFNLLHVVTMDEFEQSMVNNNPLLQLSARRRFHLYRDGIELKQLDLSSQIKRVIEQTASNIMNGYSSGAERTDWPEFCITLGASLVPMVATATWRDDEDDPKNKFTIDEYSTNINPLSGLRPFARHNRAIRTQILIGRDELLAVAEFVASVGKNEADSNSSTVPGSTEEGNSTPDTKKASGTGIHEGLQNDKPAPKAQTVAPDTAQSATGKGRKQSSRPSAAGSGAGQRSTSDQQEDKTWDSRSVSPKAPVACSNMFERLTA